MTLRRFVLVVGALVLVVGIIGLLVPVSVSDGSGGSLGCGNAAISDLSSAREANNKSVANIPILNQIIRTPILWPNANRRSPVGGRGRFR